MEKIVGFEVVFVLKQKSIRSKVMGLTSFDMRQVDICPPPKFLLNVELNTAEPVSINPKFKKNSSKKSPPCPFKAGKLEKR